MAMSEAERCGYSPRRSGREVLLCALRSFADEAFAVRLPDDLDGIDDAFVRAFNAAAETNERLARLAGGLAKREQDVARASAEVERQRAELDERAGRLARDSRCGPEVLAGLADELRAPLGSMLALAKLLADNAEAKLSSTQVDYAQTIYSAGTDLLALIDDILDGARIEAGAAVAGAGADLRPPAAPGRHDEAAEVAEVAAAGKRGGGHGLPEGGAAYYGRRSRRSDVGVVLIAEGDARFASVMLGRVRSAGYQGVVAADHDSIMVLLRELRPDAVLLGGSLRDVDGWELLERIRSDPESRLLPIGLTQVRQHVYRCLQMAGAAGLSGNDGGQLPTRVLAEMENVAGGEIRKLLLAVMPEARADAWGEELRRGGAEVRVLAAGEEVIAALRGEGADALLVDAELPDMTAIELLKGLLAAELPSALAVAVLAPASVGAGGVSGGRVDVATIRRRERFEEVLGETTVFLERTIGSLPHSPGEMPHRRRQASAELAGRKVLMVDGDIRHVFALTGALEQHGVVVLQAADGREGIDVLRENPDIDVVLMDIAMPGSNGCEAIRSMRGIEAFRSLPILAVTDRAVPGGREKCLEAGASDYLPKPVNSEHLLSLMRVWLEQPR